MGSSQAPRMPSRSAIVGVGAGADVPFEVDAHLAHLRALARLHVHHQAGARARLARDAHLRREVALVARVAGVLLGQHDQVGDLGVVEVAHFAVAAQLQVALEQLAQGIGRVHDEIEGWLLLLGERPGRQQREHQQGCDGKKLANHGTRTMQATEPAGRRRNSTHAGAAD